MLFINTKVFNTFFIYLATFLKTKNDCKTRHVRPSESIRVSAARGMLVQSNFCHFF